jgi:hypothetical protein
VTVATHGMPLASHWSLTGLDVSGVDETSIRSMPAFWMRSAAAAPSGSAT